MATAAAETLWPTRCVGCDLPGELLCENCRRELPFIDARLACRRCGAPYGWASCTQCSPAPAGHGDGPALPLPGGFPFAQARAALSYEGVGKQLVTSYKDAGEQRLAAMLAELVAHALAGDVRVDGCTVPEEHAAARPRDWTPWADALVVVPATRDAVRRRGFDHMELLARELEAQAGLPVARVLRNARRVDQRVLSRDQRADNLAHAFAVEGPAVRDLRGSRLVLVDDVVTTGATTSAAARTLLDAGAHEVRVAATCRVW